MSGIPLMSVLLFGFANLFADATSMGLGNYLAVMAGVDVYRNEEEKEKGEIEMRGNYEKPETISILMKKGFTEAQAQELTNIMMKNEDYWVEFMMKNELAFSSPDVQHPMLTALATFFSFIIFGAIPLLPYIFFSRQLPNLFMYSILFTLSSLLLLGVFRWKVTEQHIVRSIFETFLVGILSASVAYGVGSFFNI
jgi:predicted membrane protein (TIGR00267 family)